MSALAAGLAGGPAGVPARNTYDVAAVRQDFPILARRVNNRPLVYLDNGASAQKPRQVLETMKDFQESEYSNVHRGVHWLSQRATERYEGARVTVARFLNASSPDQIVFTGNATEAFNLIAHAFGAGLEPGDEVLVTEMEHHANIVPWQLLGARAGTRLVAAPIEADGSLDPDRLAACITARTRLIAVTHCSNVLGTITPARRIVELARARGIPVLFDGSQAAVHMTVDVQALDPDFYIFTGHKLYGPTGIGVLYARAPWLDRLPPFLGGGDMIESVSFAGTSFKSGAARFEAGTPRIVEAIGLAAAIDYVTALGMDRINAHEARLLAHATARLEAVEGVTLYGRAPEKAAILAFTVEGIHPHDLGTILDKRGVAVRVGQHCAEPLMARLGVPGTARASCGLYNTEAEIDALVDGIALARELFA